MPLLNKIDSNTTGLRFAEELSFKVLPVTPTWTPLEPQTYADFGGEVTTVARNPINPDRQRKKGVVTDLDATGGFNTDLTQENLQFLLQGFMFANLRLKNEFGGAGEITNVDGTAEEYDGTSIESGFFVGDLIFASGFTNAANNGLKRVTSVVGPNTLGVAEDLVDETSPPTAAKLVAVGFQFAAGDLDVDATGTLPQLTTTTKDLTELGLIPGEWIFVGGDVAGTDQFATAANNGFKRVLSVTTNAITIDKSDLNMVTEASTTETMRVFVGRALKNETGTNIVRRSYQLERTLGVPNDDNPTEVQAEYLVGAIANEFTLNVATADKITADLAFIAADLETIDAPTALKTGNRPALVEADAFNTSSDFSRIRMASVDSTDEAPTPLFAFIQELTLAINNNASPNKAVGTLGAFEVTSGTFEVTGSLTAYFQEVSAIDAVRNNNDITLDFIMVKSNSGIAVDVPLIALNDGRPTVEQDAPILIPLGQDAATGAKVDPTLDHTLFIVFFDFLPNAADT